MIIALVSRQALAYALQTLQTSETQYFRARTDDSLSAPWTLCTVPKSFVLHLELCT